MNGDLKITFIQKCMTDYMISVREAMTIAARRLGVGVTNEGINSISYQTLQKNGGITGNLSFNEYLRFVDMGAGRGHPLGGLAATRVALLSKQEGLALIKDKVRKPKKFYSKIAYGKLIYLENKILHGFTEETIEMLKQEMTGSNG